MSVRAYIREAVKTHPFNFFTLLIALLAAAFAGWSAWETHLMRLGADETAEDAKRSREAAEDSAKSAAKLADGMEHSAKAAEDAAEAARGQLHTAIDSLIAEYRPVLEITELRPDYRGSFSFTIRNSGRSTAERVVINAEQFVVVHEGKEFDAKEKRTSPSSHRYSISDIPSGGTSDVGFDLRAANNNAEQFHGQITYRDTIGRSFALRYCYRVLSPSPGAPAVGPCPSGSTTSGAVQFK